MIDPLYKMFEYSMNNGYDNLRNASCFFPENEALAWEMQLLSGCLGCRFQGEA